jgi:septal ring factor EnvC (AmiA/AmiB activator)
MARKTVGKTLSRTLRLDLQKNVGLPKKLQFLSAVKYTSVSEVVLPGKDQADVLVELTPRVLKKLIERAESDDAGRVKVAEKATKALEKALKTAAAEVTGLQRELKKARAEIEEMLVERTEWRDEWGNDKRSLDQLLNEVSVLRSQNLALNRVNEQLISNKKNPPRAEKNTGPVTHNPDSKLPPAGDWLHKYRG